MAIKKSSAGPINALLTDLESANAVTRDTAMARLAVIGARAVDRLIALVDSSASGPARAAALQTLEAIADVRALDVSLRALADADVAVAAAAAGVARLFIKGVHGVDAVDRLTAVALDRARPDAVRLASLHGLRTLAPSTIAPVLQALAEDPREAVRADAGDEGARSRHVAIHPEAVLDRAAHDGPGDDPMALREAIVRAGRSVPLSLLLTIVERVRERERSDAAARRPAWTAARAAAHVVLAQRGSRLALYDLRESLDSATPPPVAFAGALSLVGDASCLEAIASALARSAEAGRGRDDWWRQHLRDAFRAIAGRERITGRHAVMKKIVKKWPGAMEELGARRSGGSGRSGRSGRSGGSRG